MEKLWSVPEEWPGETVFIICGGPSALTQDVERLKGRRVIVVNSSYELAPWADILFFGDTRWWTIHAPKVMKLPIRVVTCSNVRHRKVLFLARSRPPEFSTDRSKVSMRRTSLTAAINLAAHMIGKGKIVLLGADGKKGEDGKTHHHSPHPWPPRPGCWEAQRKDLAMIAPKAAGRGIEIVNASPGSAWDIWPIVELTDVLCAGEVAATGLDANQSSAGFDPGNVGDRG